MLCAGQTLKRCYEKACKWYVVLWFHYSVESKKWQVLNLFLGQKMDKFDKISRKFVNESMF